MLMEIAANQRMTARMLSNRGAAKKLGWYGELNGKHIENSVRGLLANPAMRACMSARGMNLIDGNGAERVIKILQEHHVVA